jgi:DNA-binding NtrC family response regulator
MPHHIYCVDGAESFLTVMRDLFEEEGFRISTSAFLPNVAEHIRLAHPDLLILDLEFGTSVGWDLLAHLEEDPATASLPILIVSTDHRQLDEAISASPDGRRRAFRQKPFDIDDLLADVEQLMRAAVGAGTE